MHSRLIHRVLLPVRLVLLSLINITLNITHIRNITLRVTDTLIRAISGCVNMAIANISTLNNIINVNINHTLNHTIARHITINTKS